MSQENENEGLDPRLFEQFIQQFFSKDSQDAQEMARAAGLSIDPEQLAQVLKQLQRAMANSTGPVDWEMADQQGRRLSSEGAAEITVTERRELQEAFRIGSLWLSEVTEISSSAEPKLLSREMWAADSLPLFKEIAEPIAESVANALSDNLSQILPAELESLLGSASKMLKSAGGSLFALQLGQSIGKMAKDALSAGEIGIPISNRPGIVPQNLHQFATGLGVEHSEIAIYLAVRELALTALFEHSGWLRDSLVTQVREFAAGLTVDVDRIAELTENFEPGDEQKMSQILQAGALIAPKSEDQLLALGRIELQLALIEGWVETIANLAAKRLPKLVSISEAVRRRRAVGSAAEKTFATVLGLELRPRLIREAAAMWQLVNQKLGAETRDSIWSHPDQLPTAAEIANPQLLIDRLQGGSDQWDLELKKLLD